MIFNKELQIRQNGSYHILFNLSSFEFLALSIFCSPLFLSLALPSPPPPSVSLCLSPFLKLNPMYPTFPLSHNLKFYPLKGAHFVALNSQSFFFFYITRLCLLLARPSNKLYIERNVNRFSNSEQKSLTRVRRHIRHTS